MRHNVNPGPITREKDQLHYINLVRFHKYKYSRLSNFCQGFSTKVWNYQYLYLHFNLEFYGQANMKEESIQCFWMNTGFECKVEISMQFVNAWLPLIKEALHQWFSTTSTWTTSAPQNNQIYQDLKVKSRIPLQNLGSPETLKGWESLPNTHNDQKWKAIKFKFV